VVCETVYEAGSWSPPENIVTNPGFEVDYDADGVPDFWYKQVWSGSGDIVLVSDSRRGTNAVEVSANTTASAVGVHTPLIPVKGGRKLFLSVDAKSQRLNNSDIAIIVFRYKQDESADGSVDVLRNGDGDQTWTTYTSEITILSTTRFIKVWLGCETPDTASAFVLFDDVILSEQRAASGFMDKTRILNLASGSQVEVTNAAFVALRAGTCDNPSIDAIGFADVWVYVEIGASGGSGHVALEVTVTGIGSQEMRTQYFTGDLNTAWWHFQCMWDLRNVQVWLKAKKDGGGSIWLKGGLMVFQYEKHTHR